MARSDYVPYFFVFQNDLKQKCIHISFIYCNFATKITKSIKPR